MPIGEEQSLIRYNTVAYDGSQFVAAGESSRFAISSNGVNWETDQIASNNQPGFAINRITHSENGWYAFNYSVWGSSFMSAEHPSEWVAPDVTSNQGYKDGAYGNGVQLILISAGRVWRLPDGAEGGPVINLPGSRGDSIVFAKGLFVICGSFGTILTSPDGENWTVRSSGVTSDLTRVIFADDEFVIVGYDGVILRSTNGTAWDIVRDPGGERLHDIASFKNHYYILAHESGGIFRSDRQGSLLNLCILPMGVGLKSITSSEERIVVVGGEGFLMHSSDGERWYNNTNSQSGTGAAEYAFIDNKGVVARDFARGLEFSTNLISWRTADPDGSNSLPFAHKGNFYRRNILTSDFYSSENGSNWEPAEDIPILPGDISHIISANDILFAFNNGILMRVLNSTSEWQSSATTAEGFASSLRYEDGEFILTTEMAAPDLRSEDGLTWTNRKSPGEEEIQKSYATFKGKHFMVINDRVHASNNGDNWFPVEEPFFDVNSDPYYRFFEFESGLFLADWKGNLYATYDGENWVENKVLVDDIFWIENMVEFENRILAIGARGQIYADPISSVPNIQTRIENGRFLNVSTYHSDPTKITIYHETSDDLEKWNESLILPQEGSQLIQASLDLKPELSSQAKFHRISVGPGLDFSGLWTGNLNTELVSNGNCSSQNLEHERVSYQLNWLADDSITIDRIEKSGDPERSVFTGSIDPKTLEIGLTRKVDSTCQVEVECGATISGTSDSGLELTIHWSEQICGEENCFINRTLYLYH